MTAHIGVARALKKAGILSAVCNWGVRRNFHRRMVGHASSDHASHLRELCEKGLLDEALQAVEVLGRGKVTTQMVEFILQECIQESNLAAGMRVHSLVISGICDSNVYVDNKLIQLFASCGRLLEAYQIFRNMRVPNKYSWQTIISAYAKDGQSEKAIELYHDMFKSNIIPDAHVYASLIRACASIEALLEGRLIHGHILESRCDSSVVVGNALVTMYAKCGDMEEAQNVFDNLLQKDVVSWSAIIGGYLRHADAEEALRLFQCMKGTGVEPNRVTYLMTLKACASISALDYGKLLHLEIIKRGLESDLVVANMLVDMYCKCGSLGEGQGVFDKLQKRDVVSWTALIGGCALVGRAQEALQNLQQMQEQGVQPNRVTFLNVFKACSNAAVLDLGQRAHIQFIFSGLQLDVPLENALISMYITCGGIEQAREVFDRSAKGDLVSWNVMIAGYAQNSYPQEALDLFQQMKVARIMPDRLTLVHVLKACTSIGASNLGRQVHAETIRRGFTQDVVIVNTLLDMYLKFECLGEAWNLFHSAEIKDAATWTAMIRACSQAGCGWKGLDLFHQMQQEGVVPNKFTFLSILGTCCSNAFINEGAQIHTLLVRSGLGSDIAICNSLIDMYSKCGCLPKARNVFDTLSVKDVVSWTSMLGGYVLHGHPLQAMELFQQMLEDGTKPDKVTFLSVLQACCSVAALDLGRQIHNQIVLSGFESDMAIMNLLVHMYAKCGDLNAARSVFDNQHEKGLAVWNTLISGYAQYGHCQQVLQLYQQLEDEGVEPDKITFLVTLNSCSSIAALDQGKRMHEKVITSRLDADSSVMNCLLDLYAKCGSLDEARKLFQTAERNVVSYTTMIGGYSQHGYAREALTLFQHMAQQGLEPNRITFLGVIKACGSLADVEQGKQVHLQLTERGILLDVVLENALLDMYARCGAVHDAEQVFKTMSERDATTWAAMAACYVQHGHSHEAIQLFQQMQQQGREPDGNTLVSILKACASQAALDLGEQIHHQVSEKGLLSDTAIANALIDMYAKCGKLEEAVSLFSNLEETNVVSWTAIIGGYAFHGQAREALRLFEQMLLANQKPNDITFVCILSACSHAGLLDDGFRLFLAMSKDHGVTPGVEHYGCMVDLLARAGHLQGAVDFIDSMSVQPDSAMWLAVLGACQVYRNVEIGRRAFDCILQMKPGTAAAYDLMSNIYASANMWDEVNAVQARRRIAGVKKTPGKTWISLGHQVHSFVVEDGAHPERRQIFNELFTLTQKIKVLGSDPSNL